MEGWLFRELGRLYAHPQHEHMTTPHEKNNNTMAKRRSGFRRPKLDPINNQPLPSFVAYLDTPVYAF
jgi:hypothetical protein